MLDLETALAVVLSVLPLELALSAADELAAGGDRRPRARATAGRWPSGSAANLCVIDPAATWTVDPHRLASRSRNTPYAGWTLTGRVRHTVSAGEAVVVDGGGAAMTRAMVNRARCNHATGMRPPALLVLMLTARCSRGRPWGLRPRSPRGSRSSTLPSVVIRR